MTKTEQSVAWTNREKTLVAGFVVIWFATAAFIGSQHLLVNIGGDLIPPIALTAVVPVAIFLALYLMAGGFRRFVLAQDIETLTMLQHWRVVGFAFLPLYFYGALPGIFAWPAGLGDLAIGLAAPLVIMRLRADPAAATSASLVRYHYFGLLDFAVAIVTAGLTAGAFASLAPDGVTSAAMDVWPLNMFPSFVVPLFIILHLGVLLKVRALRQQTSARLGRAVDAA